MAWDCVAGHYLDFLICHHLALNIFLFPFTTAKLIAEFYNKRGAWMSVLRLFFRVTFAAPIPFAAIRAPQIEEARRLTKKSAKTTSGAANVTRFAYWRGENAPLRL
jgi:hypothetical protein